MNTKIANTHIFLVKMPTILPIHQIPQTTISINLIYKIGEIRDFYMISFTIKGKLLDLLQTIKIKNL